ncbi:hypothetical protein EHS39_29100 [Ensifer sp. MPMI2T]|nr:hypothetical protein EHS39_29100 [Ensifer sp. MPMI2T]
MRVEKNITVSTEMEQLLLRHYLDEDKDHPRELQFIPTLVYVVAYKDQEGNIIDGELLGYRLVRGEIEDGPDEVIFPFENRKKYFCIEFQEEYDSSASYKLEYEDDVVYLLKS